jgi:hypothetical protein
VRGQKLEKLLSNHEAQNKSGAIYGTSGTIVVFLFNQYSPYFNGSVDLFLEGRLSLWRRGYINSTPLEGRLAPPPW